MKYLCLITAIVFSSFASFAQQYSTTNKKAIKDFEEGQGLLHLRKYKEGVVKLEEALKKDPNFAEAHTAVAYAYKDMGEEAKARPHFLKAGELKPDNKDYYNIYFICADYLLNEGNYAEAKKYLQKIITFNPNNKAVMYKTNIMMGNCIFAEQALKHPLEFKPVLMSDKINKYFIHAYPVLTADQQTFIFSKRDGPQLTDDEDIVMSRKVNGEWSDPVSISSKINSEFNEGACTMSADGKVLVFVSCNRKDGMGACDLYISFKKGNDWTVPVNMGPNVNSAAWDSEPTISADGRTIYFTSERGGGLGLFDIWTTSMDENGNWRPAKNLGKPINTEGKEVSPFIHANGTTLYFSSNKHPGMGGYDIFYSHKSDSTHWTEPVNIGYPINSQLNDASVFISADSKKGFYSVYERKDMRFNKALLYQFDVPKELQEQKLSTYAKGTVYDAETKQKLGAKVELVDLKTQQVVQSVKSDSVNGDYLVVLTEGTEYALYVSRPGYLFKSSFFDYKDPKNFNPMNLDVYLDPIKAGKAVVLNNIFFASNSFALEDKSKTELDKIIAFLKLNSKVNIEFGGHTDDVGSDKDNLELSMKRAKSVYEYIVAKGIPASRLKYKGYGETQPVVPNDSEEHRQMNRRIEFKIL
ncbi:MAG: OmpA family protein [Cytophagaceae bacterium]